MTDDLVVLTQAASQGLGIAQLPRLVCQEALNRGELVELLPDYQIPWGIMHLVFPTRRGLVPAVRQLIDYLTEEMLALSNGAYQSVGSCENNLALEKPSSAVG